MSNNCVSFSSFITQHNVSVKNSFRDNYVENLGLIMHGIYLSLPPFFSFPFRAAVMGKPISNEQLPKA